jgi:hypothetical protein
LPIGLTYDVLARTFFISGPLIKVVAMAIGKNEDIGFFVFISKVFVISLG